MTGAAEGSPGTEWLPSGEEPQPLGSIAQYAVLRWNGTSVLSLPSGEIDALREPATGIYHRDARYLSLLRVTFGGIAPILVDSREVEHGLSAIFTNPALRAPDGRTVPSQSIVVRRRRILTDGLTDSYTISNYGHERVEIELRFDLGADFQDIFVIRGFERTRGQPPVIPHCESHSLTYSYRGADGIARRTTLGFHPRPASLGADGARYIVQMEPRATASIHIDVFMDSTASNRTPASAASRLHRGQRAWTDDRTEIETDRDDITGAIQRGLLDVEALRTSTAEVEYLAAGVPWFDTLFGRDSLLSGIELLAFCPEVLKTSLFTLAHYQAEEDDPIHDARPGKIPHELRWGELANTGEVPFGRYYGSVDATPLFIYALAEFFRWTGDVQTLRALWPATRRALEWCRAEADRGIDGFLAYARYSSSGLENQGWKDSHDAIIHPNGEWAEAPIALVEAQGYLAAAYGACARMADVLGDPIGGSLAREASLLAERIDDRFGHPELGYVLGLDGRGEQISTPASNAGHMLWCGVARSDLAGKVAERLFQPDLFSGWGVRTLSSGVPGFNPLGYHTGSVWPHDNALILHGLRWFGFDARAEQLGTALLQAALGFSNYHVPELFSGDARELRLVPTPYPVASRPQAWSAASIPYVLASMLGIRPAGANNLCVVRPLLPANLRWVRVGRLRVAGGEVDLTFRRSARGVSVEVEDTRGGVDVTLTDRWPDEVGEFLRE